MDIRGRVKGGVVVLDDPEALPEGSVVHVEPVEAAEPAKVAESVKATEEEGREGPSLFERLRDVVGIIKDGPPDLAKNHDHYLYGTPKRAK
jgi:hypothetical protein